MKVEKEFVLREIAGDYVIIPTGQTVLYFNGLITVNEIGAFLWNLLQDEVTVEDLVKAVLDEYDVDAVHSATIGKFNKNEIFYLMTKGITKEESINLLIKGFLEGHIRR